MAEPTATPTLTPQGCPVVELPEDPTHLFSANGINLDLPRIGWIASGIFTLVAIGISFLLIYRHCQYYTKPNHQRYIVRILLLVPIYATVSWFSFVYVRESIYYEAFKSLYEAFVIASFFILMLQYLGDTLADQKRMLKLHKKTERWMFPLCCLKYNPSKMHFLQYMKWGILQYVPLKVFTTVLSIVLQYYGYYCDVSWSPKFGYIWLLIIDFIAVSVATYFLIMFYFCIKDDLEDYQPLYKFLSVKLVIFFSFWQLIVLDGLVYFGFIKPTTYWSTDNISTGINAIVIDFEMVIFAIMHMKAFDYTMYIPTIQAPDQPNAAPTTTASTTGVTSGPDSRPGLGGPRGSSAPKPTPALAHRISLESLTSVTTTSSDRTSKTKAESVLVSKIPDRSQTMPAWKGLMDAFNPLDTIREIGFGIKYLYRWSRGIPVDKDSRRLMDLEVAFGRPRPEPVYDPRKDRRKKKQPKGKDSDSKKGSDGDSSDGGIGGARGKHKAGGRYPEKDIEKGGNYTPKDIRQGAITAAIAAAAVASSAAVLEVEMSKGRDHHVGPEGNEKWADNDAAISTAMATLPDVRIRDVPKKQFLSGIQVDDYNPPQPGHAAFKSRMTMNATPDLPLPDLAYQAHRDHRFTPTSAPPPPRTDRALTNFSNTNFLAKGGASGTARDGRVVDGRLEGEPPLGVDPQQLYYKDDPMFSMANNVIKVQESNESFMSAGVESIQSQPFYHSREASRSNPDLMYYGHDHEHYLRQMAQIEQSRDHRSPTRPQEDTSRRPREMDLPESIEYLQDSSLPPQSQNFQPALRDVEVPAQRQAHAIRRVEDRPLQNRWPPAQYQNEAPPVNTRQMPPITHTRPARRYSMDSLSSTDSMRRDPRGMTQDYYYQRQQQQQQYQPRYDDRLPPRHQSPYLPSPYANVDPRNRNAAYAQGPISQPIPPTGRPSLDTYQQPQQYRPGPPRNRGPEPDRGQDYEDYDRQRARQRYQEQPYYQDPRGGRDVDYGNNHNPGYGPLGRNLRYEPPPLPPVSRYAATVLRDRENEYRNQYYPETFYEPPSSRSPDQFRNDRRPTRQEIVDPVEGGWEREGRRGGNPGGSPATQWDRQYRPGGSGVPPIRDRRYEDDLDQGRDQWQSTRYRDQDPRGRDNDMPVGGGPDRRYAQEIRPPRNLDQEHLHQPAARRNPADRPYFEVNGSDNQLVDNNRNGNNNDNNNDNNSDARNQANNNNAGQLAQMEQPREFSRVDTDRHPEDVHPQDALLVDGQAMAAAENADHSAHYEETRLVLRDEDEYAQEPIATLQ